MTYLTKPQEMETQWWTAWAQGTTECQASLLSIIWLHFNRHKRAFQVSPFRYLSSRFIMGGSLSLNANTHGRGSQKPGKGPKSEQEHGGFHALWNAGRSTHRFGGKQSLRQNLG